MIRPVLRYPHQLLTQKAEPVPLLVDQDQLGILVQDMVDTAASHGALGLAAPQIGASLQVIIATRQQAEGRQYVCLINPQVTWTSGILMTEQEGCLSIPGKRFRVARPLAIEVTYSMFPGGQVKRERVSGKLARILQHEIDHLAGILINQKQTEAATLQ